MALSGEASEDENRGVSQTRPPSRGGPPQPPGRTLILLRHAKSDWSGHVVDIARPLAKRGRRQAPETGRWINANLNPLDLALVSPAERARSTWHLVAAQLDAPPRSIIDDRLYAASVEDLLGIVRELPDQVHGAVLVGHNPGMEDLVLHLTGEWVPLPTAAVASIAVPGSWATAGHAEATLRASGRPPIGAARPDDVR